MNEKDLTKSLHLPKRPFLRGIARLVDFGGSLDRVHHERVLEFYVRERQSLEAETATVDEKERIPGPIRDAHAISSYWRAVGDNLRWALNEYDKEISRENPV